MVETRPKTTKTEEKLSPEFIAALLSKKKIIWPMLREPEDVVLDKDSDKNPFLHAHLRNDCPFYLPPRILVRNNPRKSACYRSAIVTFGDFLIKATNEPGLIFETERQKAVSRLCKQYSTGVVIPEVYGVRESRNGHGTTYALMDFIEPDDWDVEVDYSDYYSLLVAALHSLADIPVEEAKKATVLDHSGKEVPVFPVKEKEDYLSDVCTYIERVDEIVAQFSSPREKIFQENVVAMYFERLKQFFTQFQDVEYDLHQSVTHSDFSRDNCIHLYNQKKVGLIDFEKTIIGSQWEDYARIYKSLEGKASKGRDFLLYLNDDEIMYTMLFAAYKSLYLLVYHLEKYQEDQTEGRFWKAYRTFEELQFALNLYGNILEQREKGSSDHSSIKDLINNAYAEKNTPFEEELYQRTRLQSDEKQKRGASFVYLIKEILSGRQQIK